MQNPALGRAAERSPALYLLAGLFFLGDAAASGLAVIPTRVELAADQRVQALTITNHTGRSVSMQMEISRWTQPENQDHLEPSQDLLATPPIFSLEPGESQIVRIGLRRPPGRQQELAYRVFAQELPEPTPEGFTGLQMVLRLSIPVFVAPAALAPEPSIDWHATISTDEKLKLTARNAGDRRAYVTEAALQGQDISLNPGNLRYVLAEGTREWVFDVKPLPLPGTELELSARINRQPVSARLRVD